MWIQKHQDLNNQHFCRDLTRLYHKLTLCCQNKQVTVRCQPSAKPQWNNWSDTACKHVHTYDTGSIKSSNYKKKEQKKKLPLYPSMKMGHLGMVFKPPGCSACSKIPQSESLVPRPWQSVVSVRWENHIANEVRVTIETFLRNTVVVFISGQFPDYECLIYQHTEHNMTVTLRPELLPLSYGSGKNITYLAPTS